VNIQPDKITEDFIDHQALRLQDLIVEMIDCCEDRKLLETKRFGLPYAELKCLILFRGERYLTAKGISGKLDVAKSRVTKLLNGLYEKGLVNRIDDPEDARIRLVSLSPKGKVLADEIGEFQKHIFREVLLRLEPQERKSVLSNLETLRAAMEVVKEQFF